MTRQMETMMAAAAEKGISQFHNKLAERNGHGMAAFIRQAIGCWHPYRDVRDGMHSRFSLILNEALPQFQLRAWYEPGKPINRHLVWSYSTEEIHWSLGLALMRQGPDEPTGIMVAIGCSGKENQITTFVIDNPEVDPFLNVLGETVEVNLNALLRCIESIEDFATARERKENWNHFSCIEYTYDADDCINGGEATVNDYGVSINHLGCRSMSFRNRMVMRLMLQDMVGFHSTNVCAYVGLVTANGRKEQAWADRFGRRILNHPNARWDEGYAVAHSDNGTGACQFYANSFDDGTIVAVFSTPGDAPVHKAHCALLIEREEAARLIFCFGDEDNFGLDNDLFNLLEVHAAKVGFDYVAGK